MRNCCFLLIVCLLCSTLCGCQDGIAAQKPQATPTTAVTTETTAPTTDVPAPVATATEISVRFAEGELSHLRRIAATTSDYAVDVLIEADGTVTDLCLLVLQPSTLGRAMYTVTDTVNVGMLTADDPLVVAIDFPGDLSAWGLSFTDAHGVMQYRTLRISGEDGSLLVSDGIL